MAQVSSLVLKLFELADTAVEDKKSCSGYPGSISFPASSSFRNMLLGERCKKKSLGVGRDFLSARQPETRRPVC